MKQLIAIAVFLLLPLAPAHAADIPETPPATGLSTPLTLEKVCAITLKNNPGMAQAEARISGARAVLRQARSAWKPTITGEAGATAIQATRQPDWAQTIRTDEAFNEYSAKLEMGWLLFDGFARQAKILAAGYTVEQSEQSRHEVKRLLVQAVSSTYHRARLALENMAIARQNQQFNQTLEKDARIKWQVGTAPEAEMLNFSVRALQAESDFLKARLDFKVTCTALTRLMALPGTPLTPEMFPSPGARTLSAPAQTHEKAMETALAARPDLKALDAAIAALMEKLRAQRGSFYPKIYWVSGMEYLYQQDKSQTNEEEHNTYTGVNLTWDLYTGGRRKGQIEEIAAELAEIRAKRKETVIDVSSEIQEALDIAETAWATWKNQEKTREMTQKVRSHVAKAYRAGVATLTRLNEAQTDLVRASGAAAASRIQYRIALVNLNTAMGILEP